LDHQGALCKAGMFCHPVPTLTLLRRAWEGHAFWSVGGDTVKPSLDLGLCLDVRKPEVSFSTCNGVVHST